jgi:hypothetical protein
MIYPPEEAGSKLYKRYGLLKNNESNEAEIHD